MVADGLQWVLGFMIAVVVHVAGIFWFDVSDQTVSLTHEQISDEIVVMLGEGSGTLAETAPLFRQTEEIAQVDSAEAALDTEPDITEEQVAEIESLVSDVPVPDQTHRPEAVEVVETLDAMDAPTGAAPESVRSESLAIESVTASQSGPTVVTSKPKLQQSTVQPVAGTSSLKPKIIDIVAPETLVLIDSESSGLVPEAVSPVEVSPVTIQTQEAKVAAPDVEPTQVSSVAVADVEPPKPDHVEAVVLDLATVETTVARETESAVVPERQVARVMTLEELQQGGTGVAAHYAGLLKGRLQENMHYPRAARLAGQEGRAIVRFVIDRNGNVLSIILEQASGYPVLDRESVEMIERANPFPIMPAEMVGRKLELRVPVVFEIREDSTAKSIPPIDLE